MKEKIILNDVQREFYNKIINTPIEEFDFSPKVFVSLLQTKFFTVYDFMDLPGEYLLNIRGFRFEDIEEVEKKLKEKYDFLKIGITNEELKKTIFNMPLDEIMSKLNQDNGRQYKLRIFK